MKLFEKIIGSHWCFDFVWTTIQNPKHRHDGKCLSLNVTQIGLVTLITLLSLTLTTPTHAANLKVLDKYFYGEVISNGQATHRQKTLRIPNVPDKMCFGWVITVEPSDELVKITEIFTLPGEPELWGGVEDDPYSQTTTTKDRKTATTNRFMPLKSGTLENSWCLTRGDQSGPHHIVVLNGTQVLAEFEFEVYD